MPRTSQKTIAAKPKTNTRLSKKPPLTPTQLKQVDAWWRASNYLSACQLYLLDNPLLKRPLAASDLKQTIVGHWGTVPGQNFIYTHLNRVIQKDDLDMIYLSGPGHGGNAMVAQDWLDGTYTEAYPNITQDEDGMRKLFKQFSFPGGVPSHVAPETPGSINEGGELGYSLAHAFGAVADNPDLIAACVVGGISFTGGIGKISGVVVGVFIFTALTYSLTVLGIDTNLQFVFSGIIILVAVTLDCLKYVQKK